MDQLTAALVCIVIMLVMLNLGLPIAYALGFSSMIVGFFTFGTVALEKLGWTTYHTLFNTAWIPLPLFAFMGCLIAQTKIGEDLFGSARLWLSRLPGALVVSSIIGQAGMAAVLGASAPTILAIGPVSIPELERYKYNKTLALAALTCGGVLGPLIPPSATAIIIAGLMNMSLGPLLIAGIIPGVLLAFMLSMVPVIKCTRNPSLGPPAGKVSWGERIVSLKRVWPIVLTFFAILGSIFFGIATATEAGGVGALIVIIVAVIGYGIRGKAIYEAVIQTVRINAQIMFILVGAGFFSYIVGSQTLARQLVEWVTVVGPHPILVVVMIQILLLILGCFIDGMTIMIITIPIFVPMIKSMGFNPLWFAVLYLVNMEMSLITPPMGINFFLVKNIFEIDTIDLLKGVAPYMAMLVVFLFLLVAFPQISLWLPGLMIGN
jgi:tripartite ATP-independent transporter DctM subunit